MINVLHMHRTKPAGTDPAVNKVNIRLSIDFSGHCTLSVTLTPSEHTEPKEGLGIHQV